MLFEKIEALQKRVALLEINDKPKTKAIGLKKFGGGKGVKIKKPSS